MLLGIVRKNKLLYMISSVMYAWGGSFPLPAYLILGYDTHNLTPFLPVSLG